MSRPKRTLPTGYISLFDAILMMVRQQKGAAWPAEHLAAHLPCYRLTTKNRKTGKSVTRFYEITVERDEPKGNFEYFHDEPLTVPKEHKKELRKAVDDMESQLRHLAQAILDGKIAGRLDPPSRATISLDNSNANVFGHFKRNAMCTGYLLIEVGGALEKCFVSFEEKQIRSLFSRRGIANDVSRGLTQPEENRFERAIDAIVKHLNEPGGRALLDCVVIKDGSSRLLHVKKSQLAETLVGRLGIKRNEPRPKTGRGSQEDRGVALRTVERLLVTRLEERGIRFANGRPRVVIAPVLAKFWDDLRSGAINIGID